MSDSEDSRLLVSSLVLTTVEPPPSLEPVELYSYSFGDVTPEGQCAKFCFPDCKISFTSPLR